MDPFLANKIDKTIIITGAAGFIGYALCKQLIYIGYTVIGIDKISNKCYNRNIQQYRINDLLSNQKFIFIQKDLSNDISELRSWFEQTKTIVHLAATPGVRESLLNPHKYVKNNICAFSNVINLAAKSSIEHLIYASSSSVYGDAVINPQGITENQSSEQLSSIYAMTKRSNELEAFVISQSFGIKTTGLRFFSVYGPYGRPDMAPWIFAESLLKNKEIILFNNGQMFRDFTYIDDVVDSIIKVIEIKRESIYEIYNIGCSKPQSVKQLLGIIEREIGKEAKVFFKEKNSADMLSTHANMKKFHTDYGCDKNFTDLSQGLTLFCNWLKLYLKQTNS